MKLKELLSKIDRRYFYLMHLSYDGEDRERLWGHAFKNKLIGLDYPRKVDKNWFNIPRRTREKLRAYERDLYLYFRQFCEQMIEGDCVLVMRGWSHLLGVGLVKGPYSFHERYRGIFFRHIRPINWLRKYEYEKRIPFKVPGFRKTLLCIDPSSSRWDLVNRELGVRKIDTRLVWQIKNVMRRAENEIYSEGGLKEIKAEVFVRNRRLIQAAKEEYGTRCKVCGFDFERKYGRRGKEFIEVHHLRPLYKLKRKTEITVDDVTVVCSNCHRMIHRERLPISLRKLKSVIRKR